MIVGGESGQGHRPIEAKWVRSIREQVRAADMAFFFKQWGGIRPTARGRELDGHTYDEMPAAWWSHLRQLQGLPSPARTTENLAVGGTWQKY